MSPSILTARSALELRGKISARIQPRHLLALLTEALRVRRERRQLLAMDDHMLKDLGLSRGDAHAEGSRSLLDLPQRPFTR